jgi:hypothetical protein
MVAELSSDRVVLGLAFGISAVVMLFVAISSRPRTPLPVLGLALLLGAGLITLSVWRGLTGKVSEAGPVAPAATGRGSPSGQGTCQPSGASLQLSAQNISFSTTCLPSNDVGAISFFVARSLWVEKTTACPCFPGRTRRAHVGDILGTRSDS